MLTGGEMGEVKIYDSHFSLISQLEGPCCDPISCFSVSNDGNIIVTANDTRSSGVCVFGVI